MSIYPFLQPQPVDPQDDGSVSPFDQYSEDEPIDLTEEKDGEALIQEWDEIIKDLHHSTASARK